MEPSKPTYWVQITKLDAAWDTEMSKKRLLSLQRQLKILESERDAKDGNRHYTGAQNIIIQ